MTERTTDHATFTIEKDYDRPVAEVFAAFATEKGLRAWLFSEDGGWTIDRFDLDFRRGGAGTVRFHHGDDPVSFNDSVYLDIVENRRIVFAYAMGKGDAPFSASLATVEFAESGSGTHLVFTEQGAFFDGVDHAESRESGWKELLDLLGASIGATAKGAGR